jgi:DNA-directed RNA polymerase subunit F
MNFIYSFLTFLFSSLILRGIGLFIPHPGTVEVLMVLSIVSFIISIIFIIVGVFYQMSRIDEIRQKLNEIITLKDDIVIANNYFSKYKTEITDKILKIYPEYEKEIYNLLKQANVDNTKQNNTDANSNQLTNFTTALSQYPELKYSQIFINYISKFESLMSQESSKLFEISQCKKSIMNIKTDNWMLPVFVKNLNIQDL